MVFREYNFSNGAAGMAVRIDNHRWDTPELNQKDNASKVYGRASCLNTLRQAGEIAVRDAYEGGNAAYCCINDSVGSVSADVSMLSGC